MPSLKLPGTGKDWVLCPYRSCSQRHSGCHREHRPATRVCPLILFQEESSRHSEGLTSGILKIKHAGHERSRTSTSPPASSTLPPSAGDGVDPNLDAPYVPGIAAADAEAPKQYADPNGMCADMNTDAEQAQILSQLAEEENQANMVAMMDVLQRLDVSAICANAVASSIVQGEGNIMRRMSGLNSKQQMVNAIVWKRHSFIEACGRGSIVDASR